MGDLIVLTRPTSLSRLAGPAGVSADILFFTGVRYYRADDLTVPMKPTQVKRPDKVKKAAPRRLNLQG